MIEDRFLGWRSWSMNHCMTNSRFDFLDLILRFLHVEEQRANLRSIDVLDRTVRSKKPNTMQLNEGEGQNAPLANVGRSRVNPRFVSLRVVE